MRLLLLLATLSEAVYLALLRFEVANGVAPVAKFLGLILVLVALQFAAWVLLRGRVIDQRHVIVLIAGAVLFRLTLVPAGLPHDTPWSEIPGTLWHDLTGERVVFDRHLLFDDDLWRQLWEGHVVASGRNPYLVAPSDPELDALAADGVWSDVRENVNHASIPAIYPPAAQLLFRISHTIAPGSVVMMKLLLVLFDVMAMLFVAATLRAMRQPMALLVFYGWNPLVIKAFAGSGHCDALVVAGLAATIYFVVRRRRWAAALTFVFAVLSKLVPIVLLPFVAMRIGPLRTAIVLAIISLGISPMLVGTGLPTFAEHWQFNSSIFAMVQAFLDSAEVPSASAVARLVSGFLIAAAILIGSRRDQGGEEGFPRTVIWAIGAVLLLGPVVMPWYVTWILPAAVIARNFAWIAFSSLVFAAFTVMINGNEYPALLALEYGGLAAVWLVARTRNWNLKGDLACVHGPGVSS